MKILKSSALLIVTTLLFLMLVTGCNRSGAFSKSAGTAQPQADTAPATQIQANAVKMRVAHIFADDHPISISLAEMKAKIEAGTNGNVSVELYGNMILGAEADTLETTLAGGLEMVIAGGGGFMERYQPGSIFNRPVSISDWNHFQRVLDAGVIDEAYTALPGKTGARYLGAFPVGFRVVGSINEIKSMADFRGVRIRIPNDPTLANTVTGFGANPIPMAMTEVFSALEQKAVDGVELAITVIDTGKYYEVLDYIIDTNHAFTCYGAFINEKFWQSLSPEYQKIVADAAKAAEAKTVELTEQQSIQSAKNVSDAGVKITVPDAALSKQLFDAQANAISEFYKLFPEAEEHTRKMDALR